MVANPFYNCASCINLIYLASPQHTRFFCPSVHATHIFPSRSTPIMSSSVVCCCDLYTTYITIYCIYNMINQSATSYLTSSFLENVLNIQFHRGICIFVNSVCLSIVSIYNNVYQDPHASVFPLYRRMSIYTHIYIYVCVLYGYLNIQ